MDYFSRKNTNEYLDKKFFIESFDMEGRRIILKQLLEDNNIESIIDEDQFFKIIQEFILIYYKYKLITKELIKNTCCNLHEVLLEKTYIPYRKLMIFNNDTKYCFKKIYDFDIRNIEYDYYEFLSYILEGCSFIYCTLKKNQKFNNIIKYFEEFIIEKKQIDNQIKNKYNLKNDFIINFVNNKIMEIDYER